MVKTQVPYWWNSVHRPIIWRFDYEKKSGAITDVGGKMHIVLAGAYTENSSQAPVTGDRVIIKSGVYSGIHVVTGVTSTTVFDTATAYISNTTVDIYFLRLPAITVRVGYDTGEAYATERRLHDVATFTPRNSPDNDIYIDVSGYVKPEFDIPSYPSGGGVALVNVFNRVRLYFDGAQDDFFQIINSGIESVELNEQYVGTGRWMALGEHPVLNNCGEVILTKIVVDTSGTAFDKVEVTEGTYTTFTT